MIAIKTNIEKMPEYCDDCRWYGCRPHPMKGWSDICELMNQCLDDDQDEGWIYDGNGRPKNCPLVDVNANEEFAEHDSKGVLEKIKAELIKYLSDYDFGTGYQNDVAMIIDKYIEGSDSE